MRSVSESVDYSSEQGVRAVKPNGKGWRKYRGLSSTSTLTILENVGSGIQRNFHLRRLRMKFCPGTRISFKIKTVEENVQ